MDCLSNDGKEVSPVAVDFKLTTMKKWITSGWFNYLAICLAILLSYRMDSKQLELLRHSLRPSVNCDTIHYI